MSTMVVVDVGHVLYRDALLKIFDLQVANLRKKGLRVPNVRKLREAVPDAVSVENGQRLPLLIVLPFRVASFRRQLAAVDLGSKKESYTFLDPRQLSDGTKICLPQMPYLICDIEDGTDTCGISPDECEKRFEQNGRFAINVSQGLAMVIHRPELLSQHFIQLSGSRIRDEKTGKLYVPDFYVFGKRMKMKREESDDADPKWGTPSYRSIITA